LAIIVVFCSALVASVGCRVCDPGETQPCTCSDGSDGSQVCEEDGSGWAECTCATDDDDDVADDDAADDDVADDDAQDDDAADDDAQDDDVADDDSQGDDDTSGEWVDISCNFWNYSPYQGACCALRGSGALECWGDLTYLAATAPSGTFNQVSLGSWHACVLDTSDEITCWGDNSHGQASSPSGISFLSVAVGGHTNCAILTDQTVYCWGNDQQGQATPPPGTFDMLGDGGTGRSCGVNTSGQVECWGQDQFPVGAGTYSVVEHSGTTGCVILPSGLVECWADEGWGLPDPPMVAFDAIDVAFLYACGVQSDQSLACWGNVEAQYEFGQTTPPAGSYRDLAVAGGHGCAITAAGDDIECWGNCTTGACDAP